MDNFTTTPTMFPGYSFPEIELDNTCYIAIGATSGILIFIFILIECRMRCTNTLDPEYTEVLSRQNEPLRYAKYNRQDLEDH